MKKYTLFVVFMLVINAPLKAGDIATETTQWANGAIMGTIRFISGTIRDLQAAIKEVEDLQAKLNPQNVIDQIPGAQDVIDLLNQVEDVIQQGRALAHTSGNLEQQMQERFASYEVYLNHLRQGTATMVDGTPITDANGAAVDGLSREAYIERYREWSTTHDQTVTNIMRAHGLQAGQFDTEKARFETLQQLSRTSEGRMQAIQIGNEIANESLLQMQKLREIIMEQSSLHASYFAKKRAMEAEETARATIITEDLQLLNPTDGAPIGFNPAPAAFNY